MTAEQAKLAGEHARTLHNLIDGRDPAEDHLAEMLGPIRNFLEELAGSGCGFDGPGTYEVAVYYDNLEGLACPAGTWSGRADSRADARRLALDEYEDDRVEGWHTEILDARGPDEDDEADDREEVRPGDAHLYRPPGAVDR